MTVVAISQSNYIPWKGYFDLIRKADYFVIYDIVQYTKNDWRNRNKIVFPSGPKWLTVPILRHSMSQSIKSTQIANQSWQQKHWRSIEQNYRKAPFFSEYAASLSSIYDKEWNSISSLNCCLIRLLCQLMDIDTPILDASDFSLSEDRNQRLLDICSHLNADTYLSGSSASSYLDLDLFAQSNVRVYWMVYNYEKQYPQQSFPFVHEVSVLDLLFNTGPHWRNFLE